MKHLLILLSLFAVGYAEDAKLYEYDAQGWLVGWHTDAMRPNSTAVAPSVRPAQARWNGTVWVADLTREAIDEGNRENERARLRAAKQKCREFNPDTATSADVRTTLAAALYLLREALKED